MKPKQLIALLAIFGGLALLLVMKQVLKPREISSEKGGRFAVSLKKDAVDRVEIKRSGGERAVLIEKTEGAWRLADKWNAKADGNRLDRFLEALSKLEGEQRADREDTLGDFGLRDEEGMHIVLTGGGKALLHLIASTKAVPAGGTFFRLEGTNQVFFTETDLAGLVDPSRGAASGKPEADGWLDLHFFGVDTANVSGMMLKNMAGPKSETPFHLIREADPAGGGARWKSSGEPLPFPVSDQNVKNYLSKFTYERARELVDPNTAVDWTTFDRELTVTMAEGTEKKLWFRKKDATGSEEYYVKTSEGPGIFLVSPASFKSFGVDLVYFLDRRPLALGESKWTAVDVHAPEGTIRLLRSTGEGEKAAWKMENAASEISEEAMSTFLQGVQNFTFERFLDPVKEADVLKRATGAWVDVTLESGEHFRIDMSTETVLSGFHVALRQGFPQGFLISESTYQKLVNFPK
jgi:hypothetical protein